MSAHAAHPAIASAPPGRAGGLRRRAVVALARTARSGRLRRSDGAAWVDGVRRLSASARRGARGRGCVSGRVPGAGSPGIPTAPAGGVGRLSSYCRRAAGRQSPQGAAPAADADEFADAGADRSAAASARRAQRPRIAGAARCGNRAFAGSVPTAAIVVPAARTDGRRSGAAARLEHRLGARPAGAWAGAVARNG